MHFLGPHFFAFPTSSSFLNLLTRFYPNREALTAKVEKRRVAVSDSTSLFDMLDQKQIRQQRVMPYLLLSANSCLVASVCEKRMENTVLKHRKISLIVAINTDFCRENPKLLKPAKP